jgi:hypothetical protein
MDAVNPSPDRLAARKAAPEFGPFVMANLLRFAENGAECARYRRVAGERIARRGGRVFYAGEPLLPARSERPSEATR